MTAPSPGLPTALEAGDRRPRPPKPSMEGIGAEVGLVRLAVIPPGQSAELWLDPGANRLSHSIRARSVSMAKTPPELAPTNARERNPRWLIRKSSSAGAVSAVPLRASFGRSIFHRKRKSGARTVVGEVFLSARTHEDRWASYPTVVQSSERAAAEKRRSPTSEHARQSLVGCIGTVFRGERIAPQSPNHIVAD